MENNLATAQSLFPHKVKHKATWVSLDHITKNETDHVATSKTHERSPLDVQSKHCLVNRGADAASDHHLHLLYARIQV